MFTPGCDGSVSSLAEQVVNIEDLELTVHSGELQLPRVLLEGTEFLLKATWSNWPD